MQKLLVSKSDFAEFVCKFKGHTVPDDAIRRLKANPHGTHEAACDRCSFQISIRMDPDDQSYCLVSDCD